MDKGKQRAEPAIPFPHFTPTPAQDIATSAPTNVEQPTTRSRSRSVHFGISEKTDTDGTAVHHNCEPGTTASAADADEEQVRAHLHRTPALSPAHAKMLKQRLRKRHSSDSMSLRSGSTLSSESSVGSQTQEEVEAQRKVALSEIEGVQADLKALQKGFGTSTHAGSVPPPPTPDTPGEAQASTPTSEKEVALYTHALDALLARLDAIESGGNAEVRQKRREMVKEVEKLVGEMEGQTASPVEEVPQNTAPQVEVPASQTHEALHEDVSATIAEPAVDDIPASEPPVAVEEPTVPVEESISIVPSISLISEALTTGSTTPADLLDAGFTIRCEDVLEQPLTEVAVEDSVPAQPTVSALDAQPVLAEPALLKESIHNVAPAPEVPEVVIDAPLITLDFSESLTPVTSATPASAGLDDLHEFASASQTPDNEVEESTVYTQDAAAPPDEASSSPTVEEAQDEADAAAADHDDALDLQDAVVATLADDPDNAAEPFLLRSPSLSEGSERRPRPLSWQNVSDEEDIEIIHANEVEVVPPVALDVKKAENADLDEVEEWSDLDSATTSLSD